MYPMAFLETLFSSKKKDHSVQILIRQLRHTSRFQSLHHAAEYVDDISHPSNAHFYFCCGLTRETDPLASARVARRHITAVPGCWMNIPIANTASGVGVLPATEDDGLEFLNRQPLFPTMVVSSRDAVQAYFLFKEVWSFARADDRAKFEALNLRLQQYIRAAALRTRGWRLPLAHSCTQFLPVCGTLKWELPLGGGDIISELEHVGWRYIPAELEKSVAFYAALEESWLSHEIGAPAVTGECTTRPNAAKHSKTDLGTKLKIPPHVVATVDSALYAGWRDEDVHALATAWHRKKLMRVLDQIRRARAASVAEDEPSAKPRRRTKAWR